MPSLFHNGAFNSFWLFPSPWVHTSVTADVAAFYPVLVKIPPTILFVDSQLVHSIVNTPLCLPNLRNVSICPFSPIQRHSDFLYFQLSPVSIYFLIIFYQWLDFTDSPLKIWFYPLVCLDLFVGFFHFCNADPSEYSCSILLFFQKLGFPKLLSIDTCLTGVISTPTHTLGLVTILWENNHQTIHFFSQTCKRNYKQHFTWNQSCLTTSVQNKTPTVTVSHNFLETRESLVHACMYFSKLPSNFGVL